MGDVDLILLVCAGLAVVSVLTSLVAFRVGAPLLLLFLLVGLVAGEDGPGGIVFNDAPVAYLIGSAALAVILFDSGFHTRLSSYRHAAAPAIMLATAGVAATAGIVALACRYLLGLSWPQGLLLGTILSSTDAAALFFLLRVGGITIRDRVRSTLEVESGTNDPLAIFLVLTLVAVFTSSAGGGAASLIWHLVREAGGGVILGTLGGAGIVALVNRSKLEPGLMPVVVMALAVVLFALTNMIGGSGFLAAYLAGLVAGNARLQSVGALRRFQDGVIWLAQIAMFVTLGLLATPRQFPSVLGVSIAIAAVLIFVARPIAAYLCLLPFRFSNRERVFVAWVGLRGAVSILLALVPFLGGMEGAGILFDIVFVVVMVSLVVQGWTVRPLARSLELIVPGVAATVDRTEIDLPGLADHEIVAYPLRIGTAVAQGRPLPRWARPVLVRRHGQVLTGPERLEAGDQVYFVASAAQIPLLDRLFRGAADESETEATLWGEFSIGPEVTVHALRETYGLGPTAAPDESSLGDLFLADYGADLERGDRIHLGPVDLIAREVGMGRVLAVGIALEPAPPSDFWHRLSARLAAALGAS